MSTPMLAASWMGFLQGLFVVLFILSCVLLICVVLLQKGRGGGLSSAFGGAMGSSPFGTKTGDVFTWITVVLSGMFLGAALVLNVIYKPLEVRTGQPAQAASTPDPGERPPAEPDGEDAPPPSEATPPEPSADAPSPETPQAPQAPAEAPPPEAPPGPEESEAPPPAETEPSAAPRTQDPPGADRTEAAVPPPVSGTPTTQPDQ